MRIYSTALVLAVMVLVWDLNVGLGLAGGVPYMLVVLAGFWARNPRVVIHLALVGSLLTLAGGFFSPPGGEFWKVASNRLLALLAIWVTAYLCVLHRKKTSELESSKASLEVIFNSVPAMIWFKDRENRILKVNQVAAQTLGLPVEQIEGRHTREFHPDEADEYFQDDLEVITQGKPKRGIIEPFQTPEGKRLIMTEKIPYRDAAGHIQGVIVFAVDVEDTLKAREQLNLLSTAIEQSPTAVMITDSQGVIQYVNPSFVQDSGYAPEELTGETPRLLKSGEHSGKFYEDLWNTLLAGKVWRGEFRNRHKNGDLHTELVSIHPIRNTGGQITQFVWVKIDDVERRKAAIKLREYAQELARSNQDLDEFASIASHDLQEPLRKIVAFGGRLKEGYQPLLDEKGKNYLDRMIKASERLIQLVQDLIDLARVNHTVTTIIPTDLNRVVDQVVVDLEFSIEESESRIIKGSLPRIDANATQMRQLFNNLISNALKFHRKGVAPCIQIESRPLEGGKWEITVADNGIGFDELYLEKIFKPFERLHSFLDGYKGSGIGLALCRKIVVAHGGVIWANSKPGQGATFTIHLPETQSFAQDPAPF